ncbi:unnamed protein product [Caenorhabditis nigoni]
MFKIGEYYTMEWVDLPENVPKSRLAAIQLAYGIPSILLMFIMFLLMGCSKKYSSSFYRLNIVGWLNSWIALRFAEFPFGTIYIRFFLGYIPWLWNVSIFIYTCMFHVHFCSAISLSIHRISSILFFNSYEKFWSRYYLVVYIVYCLLSSLPNLLSSGLPPQLNLINGTLWFSTDIEGTSNFNVGTNVFAVIYFISLVGTGIAVPIIIRKQFQGSLTESTISKKLTKIAVTSGFVYSGILLWSLLNAINTKFQLFPEEYAESISFSVLSCVSDVMTLAFPYILLIFDSNIKRDFTLVFQKSTSEVSSTVPVIMTS